MPAATPRWPLVSCSEAADPPCSGGAELTTRWVPSAPMGPVPKKLTTNPVTSNGSPPTGPAKAITT
ncbi:hypothetical protein [Nonomuraea recticatena]|uniref:hypothetical protein n=1 Tax=Nonomuraea recticatena TaxID=46178 RepID=UPI00361A65FE